MMKRLIALIITAALLLTFAGCSLPKTGKNNINKYTYAKDNKAVTVEEISDSDFDMLAENEKKYTIDEMDDIFGLGTIRQTVIADSANFVAYSVYENSKGDLLYVFYDRGFYADGEYTNGWGIYKVVKYDSASGKWQKNHELRPAINELDLPEE